MSLSHLRPLDFGEILDGAFTLYRRHFSTMFLTALLPLIPLLLYWAGFAAVVRTDSPDEIESATTLATVISYPLLLAASFLVYGALVHQVARALEGGAVERGEAYRVALRRFFPLLGASILTMLCAAVGLLLLIVPAFLVMIMFFAASQAVVVEGKGPVEALKRSRALASGSWGRIAGIWLVTMLIVMAPSMVVGGAVGAVAVGGAILSGNLEAAAVMPVWATAVTNLLSTVMSALTTPFMVATLTLLYFDLRVRSEALDLQVATEGLAPAS